MAAKFSRSKLASEIVRRLDAGESVDKISQEIAAYLISNGKTSELNSLLRDCMEKRAEGSGIVEVTATSAFEVNANQKKEIEAQVHKIYPNVNKVIIHGAVDPSVIGGLNLSFANANLDMTIRDKLNQLRTLVG